MTLAYGKVPRHLWAGQRLQQQVEGGLQGRALRMGEPLRAGAHQPCSGRRHQRVAAKALPALAAAGRRLHGQRHEQLAQAAVGRVPLRRQVLLVWRHRPVFQCNCDRILCCNPELTATPTRACHIRVGNESNLP